MKIQIQNLTVMTMILGSSIARADLPKEAVISDEVHSVKISLNRNTVLCSKADYGAAFLKIIIPELAAITLLDHRNIGAGGPCVAAGMCMDGNDPSDVIGQMPSEVDVPVRIIRSRIIGEIQKDQSDQLMCRVTLKELVEVPVAGKVFTHLRFASLGQRRFEDCQ